MAYRKPVLINWFDLENEYRTGSDSLATLGLKYGCSDVAIMKRAKKYGWTRDLQEKIKRETENKLNQMVAEQLSEYDQTGKAFMSYPMERRTIEINAQMQADIILSHRKDIKQLRDTVGGMVNELGVAGDPRLQNLLNQLSEQPTVEQRVKALGDALSAALALPTRAGIAVRLVNAMSTLIDKEREAFGMTSQDNRPQSLGEVLDAL